MIEIRGGIRRPLLRLRQGEGAELTATLPVGMAKAEGKPRVAKEKKEKKEAKPKVKKDPDAPKRALSAYMFFSKDARAATKEENPDATFGAPFVLPVCALAHSFRRRGTRQAARSCLEGDGRRRQEGAALALGSAFRQF